MDLEQTIDQLKPLGFERIETLDGNTFKDNSTVIIIPTLGQIDQRVVNSWLSLMAPMNQKRAILFARGQEVGQAYDNLVEYIIKDPNLSTWKYILTLEDDNIQPSDTHIRLLESINAGPFDAISGLYWTKGDFNMPMCYGSPEIFSQSGYLEFAPRDVGALMKNGQNVIECNGIAMGCSLYRMSLFKEIPRPWFNTICDIVPEKNGVVNMTQDLFFCEKARRAGKRFAVDLRVRVGHLDVKTGIVY